MGWTSLHYKYNNRPTCTMKYIITTINKKFVTSQINHKLLIINYKLGSTHLLITPNVLYTLNQALQDQ